MSDKSIIDHGYKIVSKKVVSDYDNVYDVVKGKKHYIVKIQEKSKFSTNEIKIYRLLKGKGISVDFIETWNHKDLNKKPMVYIVMDKWDGTVTSILSKLKQKDYTNIIDIVNKFHNMKLIHNDFHTSNILYKRVNGAYKFGLIDFQFTKKYKTESDEFNVLKIQDLYMIFNNFIHSKWFITNKNKKVIGFTFEPFLKINNPKNPMYIAYRYFRMAVMNNKVPLNKIHRIIKSPFVYDFFKNILMCDKMYNFMGYTFKGPNMLYNPNNKKQYRIESFPLNKKVYDAGVKFNKSNIKGTINAELVDVCVCHRQNHIFINLIKKYK